MASNGSLTVKITKFGLLSNNDRTMVVQWSWEKKYISKTDHYEVQWYYFKGGSWYSEGSPKSKDMTETTNDTYSPPDIAKKVKVRIRPVSKTHKNNDKDETYFTASWKMSDVFTFGGGKVENAGSIKSNSIALYIEKGSDRNVIADWEGVWKYTGNTDHYEVVWEYTPGGGMWYPKSDEPETVPNGMSMYAAPDNAKKVRIKVKPIAETHMVNGVETAYWTADWSNPETVYTLKADPVPNAGSPADIKLDIVSGTERDLIARWTWDVDHTDSFEYEWAYDNGMGFMIIDSTSTATGNQRQCTYSNVPDSALTVRFRLHPIAKTHTDNGQEVAYWTATWGKAVYAFGASAIPDADTVTNVHMDIQTGTDRTVYATWEWGQQYTESYSIKWSYDTGNGFWFEEGESTTTLKQCTYSAPANAVQVKLEIRPNAETHYDNGKTVPYWTADWCEAVVLNLELPAVEELGDTVTNLQIGIQSGTDRTMYATWEWNHEHTASYSVVWSYDTGNGIWFEESETTVTTRQSIYSAPSHAVQVKVRVRPNAETYTKFGSTLAYWTARWSDSDGGGSGGGSGTGGGMFTFTETAEVPPAPSITITQYTLTAEVSTSDSNAYEIEFQIVKDNTTAFASGKSVVQMGYASFSCPVTVGGKYKARCRAITKEGAASEWSDYSETKGTIPSTPSAITSCRALTQKSVELTWTPVSNATNYEIQYTTNKLYFDSSNDVQSMSVESVTQRAIVTGLSSGEEWFFRVRATNEYGSSGWCSPASVILGKAPDVPTTWSQTTIVMVGEDAILYWVHNSEDGSHQTAAEIELTIGGKTETKTLTFTPTDDEDDEDSEEATSSYSVPTSSYSEGTTIKWRVRTKGIVDEYSPWSILRTIDVYAPPTLVLGLSQENKWYWDPFNFTKDTIYTAYGECGAWTDVLTSFPFFIVATPGPATQKAIGYYLTIMSNDSYETINQVGETEWVNEGDEIYSKYFDATRDHLMVALTPSDIDLENGMSYTVHCSVYMDSGLMAEASAEFRVEWAENIYIPNMEIGLDKDTITTYICPYCEDEDGNLVKEVLLSVYRREFDGTYTELGRGIPNNRSTYITDPHPALDYARYRIITVSQKTGAIGYYDPPGYPVNIPMIVIQWSEDWSEFEGEEDEREEPPWTGSMLKLPFNIDVSDDNEKDVSLVKYIGRSHPVSYYGTQVGGSATWNAEIDRTDAETLYQLRRLMRYMGDVYVREPSGSGYWANIAVSFSQKHCEVTIPVTLSITRVDGGA